MLAQARIARELSFIVAHGHLFCAVLGEPHATPAARLRALLNGPHRRERMTRLTIKIIILSRRRTLSKLFRQDRKIFCCEYAHLFF
jgi:hypothetical protein